MSLIGCIVALLVALVFAVIAGRSDQPEESGCAVVFAFVFGFIAIVFYIVFSG